MKGALVTTGGAITGIIMSWVKCLFKFNVSTSPLIRLHLHFSH